MGIHIAVAIMQVLHESGGSVAYGKGHRLRQHVLGVCLGGFIGHIGGVGFRRHGQVNYGVAQMYITFGHSQKMTGLVGRHCQRQCLAVRHPYVLTGKTDQPAGHIQRILPSFQHTRQPVYGCVRVGIAHGLVERGYKVVVFFPFLIVQKTLFSDALLQHILCDRGLIRTDYPVCHCHFQGVQSRPGIPVCKPGNHFDHMVRDFHVQIAQSFRTFKRVLYKAGQVILRQCLEHKDPAP